MIIRVFHVEPGETIREAREARGWSQAELGNRVGVSQVAIAKIEAGETRMSKFLPRIAQMLDVPLASIFPEERPRAFEVVSAQPLRRDGDFPIYAAAEGGPGEIIRSTDPLDWQPRPRPVLHVRDAYGLMIVGESMVPEYRPRDIALVNPRLPVISDEVYIFYAEREGEARATIKHLRRATPDKWLVSQHNPPNGKPREFTLLRKEWQLAHRVVGKYARS